MLELNVMESNTHMEHATNRIRRECFPVFQSFHQATNIERQLILDIFHSPGRRGCLFQLYQSQ